MDPLAVHLNAPSDGAVLGLRPEALSDDVEITTALRLGHARITIPWALTQPRPGAIDGGVVEELLQAATALRGAGVAVWWNLLSRDVPLWFDDEGGFTDDRTALHWWPRWVELAADAFGPAADGWIPFEAPFALAERLAPGDPRRHGGVVDTLVVAWRDAWRILHGPAPVAASLDVRTVPIPRDDVPAAEAARRIDHLRWRTWLRALRDGSITIPGRADRELADLAGSCDQLGIAVSGDGRTDLEALLHRTAEAGPDRPLAVTFRPVGADRDARAEAVVQVASLVQHAAGTLPVARLTWTDLDALALSRT